MTTGRSLILMHQAVQEKSYDLLIVFSPSFASAFIVHHHATELALMLAGLLPHDGSAGRGGSARHGCCKWTKKNTRDGRKQIQILSINGMLQEGHRQSWLSTSFNVHIINTKLVTIYCATCYDTNFTHSSHTIWNENFLNQVKLKDIMKQVGKNGRKILVMVHEMSRSRCFKCFFFFFLTTSRL